MIVYFMSWNAVKDDVYFWERIGYRNAWVTIMQLPILFLLSMKFNIIGFLIGSSHERLNWLHRWIARTMFVTATVHGFHFWTEWVRADFLEYELAIMPLVRYGLGAWGVLLFNVVVGFLPIRRVAYEIWLIQHILSSIAMLVLLYKHIPSDAMYLLWMAISFLVLDRAARWALVLWQNTRLMPNKSACEGMKHLGHNISARAVGDSITVITIKDVHFKWHAGQHIYLWVPRLGPVEAHPYTMACAHQIKGTCCCNSIQLIVRKHGGFSKRLHNFAFKNPDKTLTGFVMGPFGAPTNWDAYETLVLIGASTGASFITPILEHVANATHQTCVRNIEVALVARTVEEIDYYTERARAASIMAREKGISVTLHIAITGNGSGSESGTPLMQLRRGSKVEAVEPEPTEKVTTKHYEPVTRDDGMRSRNSSSTISRIQSGASGVDLIREYTSRPNVEELIRKPVERAWGETAVVVCGGKEIVARTRNCVSRLSDERAVHKGTGAQGIYLHVEEYAF